MKRIASVLLSIAVLLAAGAFALTSCKSGADKAGVEKPESAQPAASYILMEKTLADTPERNRTTMKIIVKGKGQEIEAQLKRALEDVKKGDPTVKAVIIWAYSSRDELNAPNYTAGKLEWSGDDKDYMGQGALSPNPRVEVVKQ